MITLTVVTVARKELDEAHKLADDGSNSSWNNSRIHWNNNNHALWNNNNIDGDTEMNLSCVLSESSEHDPVNWITELKGAGDVGTSSRPVLFTTSFRDVNTVRQRLCVRECETQSTFSSACEARTDRSRWMHRNLIRCAQPCFWCILCTTLPLLVYTEN